MYDGLLKKKITGIAVKKLLLSLPILVISAVLVCLMSLSGLLSPIGFPAPIPAETIDSLNQVAGLPIGLGMTPIAITSNMNNIVDTGIVRTDRGITTGYYLAVWVEKQYVLCYVKASEYEKLSANSDINFSGVLMYANSDLVSLVVDDMMKQGIGKDEASSLLYGNYIDTTENAIAPRALLYGFTLALIAVGLYVAVSNLLIIMNHRRHRSLKRAAGQEDPETVLTSIEHEFRADDECETYPLYGKKIYITLMKQWVIIVSPLNVQFMRARDLLWSYKEKKTRIFFGVLSMYENHFIKLRSRSSTISLVGEDYLISCVLSAIHERYNWVVIGFSPKLSALWSAGKGQFEALCNEKEKNQEAIADYPGAMLAEGNVKNPFEV